jgi:hypothetical protein
VSCGSDVQRWAPLDRRLHSVVSADLECRPCMHQVCPIGHPCAQQVTAETVATLAVRLLDQQTTEMQP